MSQSETDPERRPDPEMMRGMLWIIPAIALALIVAGLIIGLT